MEKPTSPVLIRQLTSYKWQDAAEYMLERNLKIYRVQAGPGDYDYLLVKKAGRIWRVVRHWGVTYVYPSEELFATNNK